MTHLRHAPNYTVDQLRSIDSALAAVSGIISTQDKTNPKIPLAEQYATIDKGVTIFIQCRLLIALSSLTVWHDPFLLSRRIGPDLGLLITLHANTMMLAGRIRKCVCGQCQLRDCPGGSIGVNGIHRRTSLFVEVNAELSSLCNYDGGGGPQYVCMNV